MQEQLFRACFSQEAVEPANIDETSRAFLALWYQRRGRNSANAEIADSGHRAWLSVWRQNLQRYALAAATAHDLEQAGIACLLLKGLALSLRHYRDTGVRGMGDIDLMVHEREAVAAVDALRRAGWRPEGRLFNDEIARQMRVRHAWQFVRGPSEDCDLHWRPVVRCYSPRVTELFWQDAEAVELQGMRAMVPSPACQLFHVCAHGLQWSWSSPIRWVPDALAVIESSPEMNWDCVVELAREANMTVRMESALQYLKTRFDAPIPDETVRTLAGAPRWERREYVLLQKPCPLGALDSIRWHRAHFRRLRPFDAEWAAGNWCVAFVEYLVVFLNLGRLQDLPKALCRQLGVRLGR